MYEITNIYIENSYNTKTSLLSKDKKRNDEVKVIIEDSYTDKIKLFLKSILRKKVAKAIIRNALQYIAILIILCFISWYATENFLVHFDNLTKKKKNIIFQNSVGLSKFKPLSDDGKKGPISIDKYNDDGTKYNLYNIVHQSNESFDSFYYDYDNFKRLSSNITMDEEYLCELPLPSEATGGYSLTCPQQYTLIIDEASYGRYASDTTHCNKSLDGVPIDKTYLQLSEDCLQDNLAAVKELCDGRIQCTLKPNTSFFGDPCNDIYKYLHVRYYCVKNKELKKQKIAIVSYADRINVNSLYENAISELYQYADIHNYTFLLFDKNYDKGRSIFFMKLHVLHETLMNALKTKEFDWIFWTDADIVMANPNIKLENFLPTDENVHYVAAVDMNGLNAGVFFLRVHPWSLNFIMRALSYELYYPFKYLMFWDQTSINDVLLLEENEYDHFVIVPQNWFNSYIQLIEQGDMLLHFAGVADKDLNGIKWRNLLLNNKTHLESKTNEMMRKEVLDYYQLPPDQQKHLTFVEYHKDGFWDYVKSLFF